MKESTVMLIVALVAVPMVVRSLAQVAQSAERIEYAQSAAWSASGLGARASDDLAIRRHHNGHQSTKGLFSL